MATKGRSPDRKPLLVSLAVILIIATSALSSFAFNPQTGVSSHPLERQTNGTSSNWSGYAAESSIASPSNNFVQSVSGSWTVPTLTCSSGQATYVATWVGIDGYADNTVEQTGTEQECHSGSQASYAWYEMYPHGMVQWFTVNPGDVMTASVTYQGHGSFLLKITDTPLNGASSSYQTTQTLRSAKLQSAEWIVEAPSSSGVLPLANFGTAKFTNAQFTASSGKTYAIDGLGQGTVDAITMNDPANGAIATPSGLTDSSSGSSFSVTYSSSSSTTSTTATSSTSTTSSASSSSSTASSSTTASTTIATSTSTATGTLSTYYFANDLSSQTWLSSCQGTSNLFDPCTVTDSGPQYSVGQTTQTNFNQPFSIVISGQSHSDRYARTLEVQVETSNGYTPIFTATVSHSFSFTIPVPSKDVPSSCTVSSCTITAEFQLTTYTGHWTVNFGIAGYQ